MAVKVAIIGAGPIGLMTALFLKQKGFEPTIFEKHRERLQSSRSVGIHAPSIALFEELGLVERILAKAQKVEIGQVYGKSELIGELSFSNVEHPFPMVLTLVQSETEKILEEACLQQKITIHKGLKLKALTVSNQGQFQSTQVKVAISFESGTDSIEFDYLIGADGHKSTVRELIGSKWTQQALPDFYAMADFVDLELANSDSKIIEERKVRLYLHPAGIVESFPLPNNLRRWVVHYENEPKEDLALSIVREVGTRTAFSIPNKASYFSRFQPYVAQADKLVFQNRVVLVGDAAQVVSPIGGQGMNLGWMECKLLAEQLEAVEKQGNAFEAWALYEKTVLKLGRKVINQSLRNTWMGRSGWYGIKKILAKILSKAPFKKIAATTFSMAYLERAYLKK